MPEIRLGGRLTDEAPTGRLSVQLNADCSISVDEVTLSPPEEGTVFSSTHRVGWAKGELNDFATIDLAASYAKMHYHDNGESVYGGHDRVNRCTVFGYPLGWWVHRCTGYWSPTGPNTVHVRTEGQFRHGVLFQVRLWIMARYWAGPGWGDYECGKTGSVPGPVHFSCDGRRF